MDTADEAGDCAAARQDVVDSPGEGFDGRVGGSSALLVDSLALGAILLARDDNGGFGGLEELIQWGVEGDDTPCFVAERDVLHGKGNGALGGFGGLRVFPHAQEVVERNVGQVGLGCDEVGLVWVPGGSLGGGLQQPLNEGDWNGQLGFGGGVFGSVVFQQLGELLPVTFVGVGLVGGIRPSVQFEGRADGANRVRN